MIGDNCGAVLSRRYWRIHFNELNDRHQTFIFIILVNAPKSQQPSHNCLSFTCTIPFSGNTDCADFQILLFFYLQVILANVYLHEQWGRRVSTGDQLGPYMLHMARVRRCSAWLIRPRPPHPPDSRVQRPPTRHHAVTLATSPWMSNQCNQMGAQNGDLLHPGLHPSLCPFFLHFRMFGKGLRWHIFRLRVRRCR